MSVGIGIDAVSDGAGGYTGRSPLDDRLLVRSEYHNLGIVMGCAVATSSTGMSYTISTGTDPVSVAVGSRSGADGASRFPVPSSQVATAAAPTSGARIDVVWARQLDPEKGDVSNQSVTGVSQGAASASPVTPAIPAGAVPLASYQVPQGATRTNQATLVKVGDRAIPYGASLGILHSFTDNRNGLLPQGNQRIGLGQINLPTPRRLNFRVLTSPSSMDYAKQGSIMIRFVLDGTPFMSHELGFNGYWTSQSAETSKVVTAGYHTVAFELQARAGAPFYMHYGSSSGELYQGTVFQVEDQGVA